jgi:hypothetical protein
MTHLRWQDIVGLFVLALPIASIARTVVFEEVFREPREWCIHKSKTCSSLFQRKFFYLFTCEYCFSHWVTIVVLFVTRYKLMYDDWKGYVVALFSLVFVANLYMNAYSHMRVEITSEKKDIEAKTREIEKLDAELEETRANGSAGASAPAGDGVDGRGEVR